MAERDFGAEIDEIKTQLQIITNKISSLESEDRALRSLSGDLNNAINSLSLRVGAIETNGLKTVIGDIKTDLNLQKMKVTRLERKDNGL
jgi:hypothetical protein